MTALSVMVTPKRGEVWLVDFEPSIGAEQTKLRPAVVVSPDSVGRLPLHIVVPITDWKPHYANFPWMTELLPSASNGLSKRSSADAFQVKSLDRDRRFKRRLGVLTAGEMDDIAAAIALSIGFRP